MLQTIGFVPQPTAPRTAWGLAVKRMTKFFIDASQKSDFGQFVDADLLDKQMPDQVSTPFQPDYRSKCEIS